MEPTKTFEPIKPFEPLQPFEPPKPFEPLKPFEPPKSFEIAKQIVEAERAPIAKEIEDIYSDALAKIDNIGQINYDEKQSQNVEDIGPTPMDIPPPLDHTKFFDNPPIDSNNNEESSTSAWLPEGYVPVEPLSPLKLSDLEPALEPPPPVPQITLTSDSNSDVPKVLRSAGAEIKEENIKNSLKEIISDLDTYAEKDRELKHDILKQVGLLC